MTLFAEFHINHFIVWPSLLIGQVGECECGSCETPVYGLSLSWAVWTVGMALN